MKTNGKMCCRGKHNAHHKSQPKEKKFPTLFCAGFVSEKIISMNSANRQFSDVTRD